jgi:hypothetical protein
MHVAGAEEPVAETSGSLDSLFALGDLRQMGDRRKNKILKKYSYSDCVQ